MQDRFFDHPILAMSNTMRQQMHTGCKLPPSRWRVTAVKVINHPGDEVMKAFRIK